MTLNQLSVFVENKPGTLQVLTDILAKNNINMRALSLAEASEFGIVRIIVDDSQKASALLTQEGFIHSITKVVGVAIPDEPGGLSRILRILSACGVNVEYMYAFLGGQVTAHAHMIFHVQDADAAVAALSAKGVSCITQDSFSKA